VSSFEFGLFLMAALVLAITAHRVSTRRKLTRLWQDDEPRVVPESMPSIDGDVAYEDPVGSAEDPWIAMDGPVPAHQDRVVGLVGLVFTVSFGAIFLAVSMYVGGTALIHLFYRIVHSNS
jgi:hypothetical protein